MQNSSLMNYYLDTFQNFPLHRQAAFEINKRKIKCKESGSDPPETLDPDPS